MVTLTGSMTLSSPAKNTIKLFMWRRDIAGVVHYIMECLKVFGAPHHQQTWQLDRHNPFIHS